MRRWCRDRSWLTHLFSVDSHLIKVGFPNFVALSVRRDRSKPLGGWWGVTQGLFKIALQALPLGHLVQGSTKVVRCTPLLCTTVTPWRTEANTSRLAVLLT